MKRILTLMAVLTLLVSCRSNSDRSQNDGFNGEINVTGAGKLIARDIVTDVIIKPDQNGDPWEIEKVAGYNGEQMVSEIFDRIYNGTLTVYDYHTGEPMTVKEVRAFEKEFDNDRSKIGKLSFTENWYYNSSTNVITKITRSVVFGYETAGDGRIGYKAAFRVDLGK